MKNEPVAWINKKGEFMPEKVNSFDIPLYTHPVKELTDEEIVSLYESSYLQSGLDEWEFDPVYFAKAILRKAQEK